MDGRFVEANGRRQWVVYAGEGSPTVILEIGLGMASDAWGAVLPEVARFTRVCSHDRAGLGRSPPAPMFPTLGDSVAHMRDLFVAAGAPGPYVLVGQSLGGYVARLFARRFPEETVGLVFVDASHEEFGARIEGIVPAELLAGGPIPPDVQARLNAEVRATGTFGDLPLVVLSRGRVDDWPAGWPTEPVQRAWEECQQALVGLSSRGRRVVCTRSGHNIHADEPELVVEAIRSVVDAARARAG